MALRDWFWIVVLGMGWGGSFFFNEILLRDLGPLAVGAGRIGVGALATWVYVFATGRAAGVDWPTLRQMGVFGMLMYAFPFTIYPIGQQAVTSGAAGIVNALTPIAIVIVSHLWPGGERATIWKSLGVLVGFCGIVLLTIPAMQGEGDSALWGLLFILLAPLSYAVAINFFRRFAGRDPVVIMAWSLSVAAIAMGTLSLIVEGVPGALGPEGWAALFMIGVVLTSVSFIVFYAILPRVGATNLSTVTFIAPVSAVLLGLWFLGETVDFWKIGGMVTIFFALLLIDGRLARWAGYQRQSAG